MAREGWSDHSWMVCVRCGLYPAAAGESDPFSALCAECIRPDSKE